MPSQWVPFLMLSGPTPLAGRVKNTRPLTRHLKCWHVLWHMWQECSEQLTNMMKGW